MSKEITDAMLQARAIASASERYDKIMDRDLWLAWKECKLAALEVDRDALVVIEGLMSTLWTVDEGYEAPIVTSVLTRLRTRLGITE